MFRSDQPKVEKQFKAEFQMSPNSFYSPRAPLAPKLFTIDRKAIGEKIRNIRTRNVSNKMKNANFTTERPAKNRRMISPAPAPGKFLVPRLNNQNHRQYFSPAPSDRER